MDAFALFVARVVEIYLGLGLVFAVAFAARGAGALDPAAREGTLGFRLLVVPGAVALWPLLLRRWLDVRSAPQSPEAAPRSDA